MSLARQESIDEHDLYPLHEEDTVPDTPEHEFQTRYLKDALANCFGQHFVTGEVCMYWRQGDKRSYVAPDVLVVEGLGEERLHRVYLAWSDPTALMVIEVGSQSTFRKDTGPKVDRYLNDLVVREYVYCSVKRDRLRMWRRDGLLTVETTVGPGERLRSVGLGIAFGIEDDGFIRVYGLDGEPLPTHLELAGQISEERRRVDEERRRADEERQRADDLAAELAKVREELQRRDAGSGAG